jgi:uncharacterized protein YdhG (YjbR/CyaY superfamily)
MSDKPRTIDEYLAPLPVEKRRALEKLRSAIRASAPGAEECISYALPAFRLGGRALVAFGAGAHHCALYPMSAATIAAHHEELAGYETTKGAIRFPPGRPLPAGLVRRIVKARVAENAAREAKGPSPRRRAVASRRR